MVSGGQSMSTDTGQQATISSLEMYFGGLVLSNRESMYPYQLFILLTQITQLTAKKNDTKVIGCCTSHSSPMKGDW